MMGYFSMMFLYFDPGLGAMLVQAIVAAAAGIVLFSKNFMYKVKSFFGLTKSQKEGIDTIDFEQDEKQPNEEQRS
jgi:hypothetical protein